MQMTRRQFGIAGATLLGGVGIVSVTSQEARAEVAMDTLDVSGDDASLSQPPSAVDLTVSGSWKIDGPTPEQARVVLQVEYDGQAEDMAEHLEMDTPASGDYSLSAQLLDHKHIDGAMLLPDSPGQVKTTDIVVRIILLAVSGGEIQSETKVEDTASLRVTNDGVQLAVGGTGSIDVTG